MEDTSSNKKAIPKPHSYIPVPQSRQKPTTTSTRGETTKFGFDVTETANGKVDGTTSAEPTETSNEEHQTMYSEASVPKNWRSSSLGQLSSYKVVNIMPLEKPERDEHKIEGKETNDDNADGSEKDTDKEEFALTDEYLKRQKDELVAMFSIKQLELEETIRIERNKQERYFTQEIIKMQKKFGEEIAHLSQKFDEEKVLLEQYNREQMNDLMEQQCFEKDEKMTCQIEEPKTKQEHKIQEMFSFAVAALFVSILSILISLLW